MSVPSDIRAFAAGADLRVLVDAAPRDARDTDALASRWAALCAANPRYHDGPILAVTSLDVEGDAVARVHAHVDSYRRLAVQPQVRTGVRLLGVTAVITIRDESGDVAVLLARRAADVRVYPNLWELGPSGGVNVPPPTVQTLDAAMLARAAFDEIEEEIGESAAALLAGPENFFPIAIIRDDMAFSDDVVLQMRSPAPPSIRAAINTGWEYAHTQWVRLTDLEAWSRDNECIPPTRALIPFLSP